MTAVVMMGGGGPFAVKAEEAGFGGCSAAPGESLALGLLAEKWETESHSFLAWAAWCWRPQLGFSEHSSCAHGLGSKRLTLSWGLCGTPGNLKTCLSEPWVG